MRMIGFTSGAAYRTIASTSPEIVEACLEMGCSAMEIYAANSREVSELKENTDSIVDGLRRFDYVSFHSPGMKFVFGNDDTTREMLDVFSTAYEKVGARCLVVHPHQVENWSVFDDFPFTIAVENMSDDVLFWSVEQLSEVFAQHPDFRMVLDVSHAYGNDPSFALTDDLIRNFGDRITHIHLSGHRVMHEPLFKTRQVDIIRNIPKGVPIIIESDCVDSAGMRREYEYVKSVMMAQAVETHIRAK
jgi:sugar phosphate isomerase/epimerase